VLAASAGAAAAALAGGARAQAPAAVPDVAPEDRVFVTCADSATVAVIDPGRNVVAATVNLTSFDEDPRPPFRFVTGGVTPSHAAMVQKPLYHGAIGLHGAAPSPDQSMIAAVGRGSSNVYFIDTRSLAVVGNRANPQAGATTNAERVSDGIVVGRDPCGASFAPQGRELWVAVRGADRVAVLDAALARRAAAGEDVAALRAMLPTVNGPSHAWFAPDGATAFVAAQKTAQLDVFETNPDGDGFTHPKRRVTLDTALSDRFGFTPYIKASPDGRELWMVHKLADRLSAISVAAPHDRLDEIGLGDGARPNQVEFVWNARGRALYASLSRVDDGGPGGAPSSRIAVIDQSAAPGQRPIVGAFYSLGRAASGLWTNPAATRLYIAHEQDEPAGTPDAGQAIVTCFDVSDPFAPRFVARIPLGDVKLPSGMLRNRRAVSLAYVRPGAGGPR
jgi:DNA-binding beta-propeller fold protein YncE